MDLPVWNAVFELILGMPVDPSGDGVEFNEAIVADALIVFVLGYLVPVLLEKLVGESVGNTEKPTLIHKLLIILDYLPFSHQTPIHTPQT